MFEVSIWEGKGGGRTFALDCIEMEWRWGMECFSIWRFGVGGIVEGELFWLDKGMIDWGYCRYGRVERYDRAMCVRKIDFRRFT